MITYRATLDVSRDLARRVARLLRAERRRRGTRRGTRALTCHWHAVLVLRWFRHGTEAVDLARDHSIARATAYRYINETIAVLAAQAPDLHQALEDARSHGHSHVILDGKVFTADRCAEKTTSAKGKTIDVWYSGKAGHHGGNIQALSAPDGSPLWVSDVEPGSVHDLTAARKHALGALYRAASDGLPTLADGGYTGAGIGVHTPYRQPAGNQVLDPNNRTYNALLRGLRALGERGFAVLTQRWRRLQRTTASPSRIGHITQAALVLTHIETGQLRHSSC